MTSKVSVVVPEKSFFKELITMLAEGSSWQWTPMYRFSLVRLRLKEVVRRRHVPPNVFIQHAIQPDRHADAFRCQALALRRGR